MTDTPNVTFHEKPYRHYKVNGLKVPSVTQVIGLLDKPALKFWAQRTAVEGVAELAKQYGADDAVFRDAEALERAMIASGREINARTFVEVYEAQDCALPWDSPGDIVRKLRQGEEDINAVMKRAAERGTVLHEGLEEYGEHGPSALMPDKYKPEYRGYLSGMSKFLLEHRPKFVSSEVVVGSAVHEFGGRLDHMLTMEAKAGLGLLDLKTNRKGEVYPREHFTQVEAYKLAAEECGHGPFAWCAVVAVGENGTFQVRSSTARPETFLALLTAFRALKADEKAAKKAARS